MFRLCDALDLCRSPVVHMLGLVLATSGFLACTPLNYPLGIVEIVAHRLYDADNQTTLVVSYTIPLG